MMLGFPLWIRLAHFCNFLFLTLLIRSGIEILGGHPKLYWSDDALPGREWLRLTREIKGLVAKPGTLSLKEVCAIEFVEDFRHLGKGQGGWRDDLLNYSDAGI